MPTVNTYFLFCASCGAEMEAGRPCPACGHAPEPYDTAKWEYKQVRHSFADPLESLEAVLDPLVQDGWHLAGYQYFHGIFYGVAYLIAWLRRRRETDGESSAQHDA